MLPNSALFYSQGMKMSNSSSLLNIRKVMGDISIYCFIFLLNYSILCSAHVRVATLSQVYFSMAFENEVVGDDMVEISTTKTDIWPQNIEYHFITLLEEKVNKGNRQTTTLTRLA